MESVRILLGINESTRQQLIYGTSTNRPKFMDLQAWDHDTDVSSRFHRRHSLRLEGYQYYKKK